MDQYIGKMLDNRYEILELIGSGGMANVYKAKCHRLNRMVAVKILKNDLAENADFRRRFRDESLAVAQLSHANIVSVYDVSRSGDTEYIVMELVDGITLKQYMERRGKMDWREALHFITQIMRALSHAHSRGIIHRDIKPQNIMVLRDGSVKVTDFGIACLTSTSQTLTQEALGSVHYISPEQARGDRTDARSDIYSAGVVLYEMLTGRLPFEGESAVSVAIQHLSSVPLAPREIDPDIPEAMELICMKAMCANLEKRYPSADAMLEDLEKFRKNNSVDLGYIRADLEEPEDHEPTQAIPTAAIQAARKERTPAEEKKRDKKLIAIVVGGFAAALLVVFLLFKFVFGGINSNSTVHYKVPDVRGKTVEEAQQMEGVKGVFQIVLSDDPPKADSNYQPGQIVKQDPKPGHVVKDNMKITVWICAKEETNLMVNVLGEDVQDAKVELTNLNLNLSVQIREVYSDEYAAGKVISSTPAAGESIKKGDSILLTVSKGPETKPVTVRNYAGLSVDDAALQAENAGLTVGTHQYEYDATVPEGSVIRQSLAPNTEVAPGTEIVFTVSKGPEPSQTTEQTVTFDIPGEYLNPELGILNVEIRQDTTVVYSTTVDTTDPAAARSVSHTFTGDKGTSITVYLYINGTEVASQVVSF